MSDPLRSFKQQPWLPLIKVAGLATLITLLVEGSLSLAATYSEVAARALSLLLSNLLGTIILLLASVGVGALGVYCCEQFQNEVRLNQGSLWALTLCLIVGIGLKSLIPVAPVLVQLDSTSLMGIVVGVFWKGRPYWRRFW
ncbi:peptide chain release factor 1 [Oscillatoria sp. FACHB-1406]|uniref:peptide chain release factor 1 n=1 Tax=Oscillatoria sp. FACHB-1406 TaxID=2692846 RepID=UPI0016839D6B|nr:peptide chain release factor 1 [Oscillatoria sp. FACHB-1406]MBD2580426.1 peptide chain release factor 1 [Oscillatoria sp. FACHB-1406]